MSKTQPKRDDGLTDIRCGKCGKFIVRTLPNASVRCYGCGTWNTKDGVIGRRGRASNVSR